MYLGSMPQSPQGLYNRQTTRDAKTGKISTDGAIQYLAGAL